VGLYGARLEHLKLGTELSVAQLKIGYTPVGLRAGQVSNVDVRGMQLDLVWDGSGPVLGGLQGPLLALTQGGGTSGGAVPDITVEDSRLRVRTPLGAVTIPLEGE